MQYSSIKTFGNERGFSCAFRQWKATHSHCSLLHGYSLGFRFVFVSVVLDEKNWVFDFGGTKFIKDYLEQVFDHTTVIAEDDPNLHEFEHLDLLGVINLVVLPAVGCEKFAETVYRDIAPIVGEKTDKRVSLVSVEVFEHGANSAIYYGL